MFINKNPMPYSFPPNSGQLETCPVCGHDDVGSYRGALPERDCLTLRAQCNVCESTWQEVYTLTLVEDIRVSDKYRKQQELKASYSRETMERAYELYELGYTHPAVMQETGLDLDTAKWISDRQLLELGLPPREPVVVTNDNEEEL